MASIVKTDTKTVPFAVAPTVENLMIRLSVEQFLSEEASLLDAWQLNDWLALFTPDAKYIVPAMDCPDADPKRDMVYIDDDYAHLEGRVKRLLSRHAHREYPSSRTRRLIGLVKLTHIDKNEVGVEAPFAVYRVRDGSMSPYVGLYRYRLQRLDQGKFLIRYRRAELAHERLIDHGAISIIL